MDTTDDLSFIATRRHFPSYGDELRYLHRCIAEGRISQAMSLQHLVTEVFKQSYQMLIEAGVCS